MEITGFLVMLQEGGRSLRLVGGILIRKDCGGYLFELDESCEDLLVEQLWSARVGSDGELGLSAGEVG
jgi:hypothetical protein